MPGKKREKPQGHLSAKLSLGITLTQEKRKFEVPQHRKSFNQPWGKIHRKWDFISARTHRTCYYSTCLETSNFRQLFFVGMSPEVWQGIRSPVFYLCKATMKKKQQTKANPVFLMCFYFCVYTCIFLCLYATGKEEGRRKGKQKRTGMSFFKICEGGVLSSVRSAFWHLVAKSLHCSACSEFFRNPPHPQLFRLFWRLCVLNASENQDACGKESNSGVWQGAGGMPWNSKWEENKEDLCSRFITVAAAAATAASLSIAGYAFCAERRCLR